MMDRIDKEFFFPKSFFFLALLGILLWAQNAWVPGFFQDGYLYAAFGKNAALKNTWLIPHLSSATYPEFGQHIPFFFLLEGLFFKICGASYLSARIFATFFTFATLCSIFLWAKRFGLKYAYFSSLLFLLIPPLIKKTRFPNMDLPLMLFIFLSLICAYQAIVENQKKYWPICGVFFGLALLTKGPVALSIPLALFIFLIVIKKIKLLLDYLPWVSLILGFLLFSLWPLSLYFIDRLDIFYDYLKTVFLDTAILARGQPSPFYTYFVFFAKNIAPWFLSLVVSLYFLIKSKNDALFKTPLIFWFSYFIPTIFVLSFAKFKYSHYLIMLYPAIALLASWPIVHFLSERKYIFIKDKMIPFVAIFLALIFSIFPIGNQSKRDPEIFETLNLFKNLSNGPQSIGIVNEAYPYFALANLMGFHQGPLVFLASLETIKNQINQLPLDTTLKRLEGDQFKGNLNLLDWSFFINNRDFLILQNEISHFSDHYISLVYFKKIDMHVLIKRRGMDTPLLIQN